MSIVVCPDALGSISDFNTLSPNALYSSMLTILLFTSPIVIAVEAGLGNTDMLSSALIVSIPVAHTNDIVFEFAGLPAGQVTTVPTVIMQSTISPGLTVVVNVALIEFCIGVPLIYHT